MHVPFGNSFQCLHVLHDKLSVLIHIVFFVFILWSRRTGEEVASTGSGVNSNRLLWMQVPFSNSLQLLHLVKDELAFLFLLIDRSRSASKVVSSMSSSIHSNGLFRVEVPFRSGLQLLHILKDELTFFFLLIDRSGGASEVVASTRRGIHGNRRLGLEVPFCNRLQLLHLFKDELTFFRIITLGSGWTSKVVASTSSSIGGYHRLFRVQVKVGKLFEVLGIGQDELACSFVFRFIIGSGGGRVTRKVATGTGCSIARYRRFRVQVEPSHLLELPGFFQDHAALGRLFIFFVRVEFEIFVLVRRIVGFSTHNRGVGIILLGSDGDLVGFFHRFGFRSIHSTSLILLHVGNVRGIISDLGCTRNGLRGPHVE
mmetsp:Transcript_14512/g.29940  ORF Transcript_14512/g.29940 Transcript_14512/m.29940 type:complete len:370 (-) Transcript_14512:42-1151(-)